MKELFTAIYSTFETSAFSEVITGGLHTPKAPKGTKIPYGAYFNPGGHTRPGSFSNDVESVPVTFHFYLESHQEAQDALTDCKALFDGSALAVDGFEVRRAERETPGNVRAAGEAFKAEVHYRFELQKQ